MLQHGDSVLQTVGSNRCVDRSSQGRSCVHHADAPSSFHTWCLLCWSPPSLRLLIPVCPQPQMLDVHIPAQV